MANVKVPPLLHKRSKTSQIAWYKANKMPLPSHLTGGSGYSAAQAKKDVGELNKQKAKEKAAAAKPVDRMELIKKAAEKRAGRAQAAKLRAAFGGEVPGARYDDPVAMARAGMPIRGYRLGEAAKPDASMAMTNQLKNKMISNKDKQTLGKIADLMAAAKNKDKKNEYVRQLGLKAMKKGEIDPARGHSPTRFGREVLNKEEVEKKEEPPFTPDKKKVRRGTGGPMSQAKWLAKQAMMKKMKELKKEEIEPIDELKKSTLASYVNKAAGDIAYRGHEVGRSFGLRDAGVFNDDEDDSEEEKNQDKLAKRTKGVERAAAKLAKEEVDLVFEQDDSMEKKEMAQTQLHFIKYAAEEILAFIDMGGEVEEWYQNKLSKVQSEVESLHSYIEGEKRRTGMVKEEEQIDESVTHWEYTGTVNGKDYSLTIPRGDDLINHLNHKKIMRQNPHLEPHEAKAVAETSGDDEEHVEVEHGGKKYTHYVTNDQEPRMVRTEEVEQVDEKAPPGAKFERMVKHIKKGYAKGGLTPKEKSIAYATAWKAYGKKEEVEQIDEVKAVKAYDKEGKLVGRYRSMDHAKQMKPGHTYKVEEEVVTEAEGKVAVTAKEKELAAHHGDKKRITYGDVVKARIKSAAEKAMKKGN